jgi:hypothetical protein
VLQLAAGSRDKQEAIRDVKSHRANLAKLCERQALETKYTQPSAAHLAAANARVCLGPPERIIGPRRETLPRYIPKTNSSARNALNLKQTSFQTSDLKAHQKTSKSIPRAVTLKNNKSRVIVIQQMPFLLLEMRRLRESCASTSLGTLAPVASRRL